MNTNKSKTIRQISTSKLRSTSSFQLCCIEIAPLPSINDFFKFFYKKPDISDKKANNISNIKVILANYCVAPTIY